MKKIKPPDHGYRFPAVIISCAVRWYMRFNLSLRNIEGDGASVPATSASDLEFTR
jgi:transposase-like protein